MARPARPRLTDTAGGIAITAVAEIFRSQGSAREKASRAGRVWKYPCEIRGDFILFIFIPPFIFSIFSELRGRTAA
jgi:hypothetical protein